MSQQEALPITSTEKAWGARIRRAPRLPGALFEGGAGRGFSGGLVGGRLHRALGHAFDGSVAIGVALIVFRLMRRRRSEVHTSELQSLMRISYAVFFLIKTIFFFFFFFS